MPQRPPRLALRFALYSALTLCVSATAFLWWAHEHATSEAEHAVRSHAGFIAHTTLRRSLRPSDFQQPVTGSRVAELDALFRDDVLVDGAMRVKLYRPDGAVTYSNVHTLIGTRPADDDAVEALAGRRMSSDVTDLNGEGGPGVDSKVLETYVPVVLAGKPVGVFELYQDYRPVAAATRAAFLPLAGGLTVSLLALYAALFPILRRVTRRLREHVDEIRHQALHDHLSGLPNRVLFRDRVERAVVLAARTHQGFAVLMLDLDRFKEINDTLGHESGDRVLEEVAGRLRLAVRDSDTVARLGGDEFAVLAHQVRGPEDALATAARIRKALADPIAVGAMMLDVDASVGVALGLEHGGDVETLIRHADIAMYVAKDLGAGVELFSHDHDRFAPEQLQLVGELRRAIGTDEIVCYYQPQASALSGELRGVEALVRWQHPTRGLLGPDQFVPLAERTGLIRSLTRRVLEDAINQCRTWHESGIGVAVSVNITGRDLLDLKLPDEVAELLDAAGLAPEFLELEITENTILADPVRTRTILMRLSALGVRIAIDDFGTGNSSLAYLKRLPVDVLKIDKTFVLNMQSDRDDAIIVGSTIALSHNLGLSVVAEGVETREAWDTLARLGCDAIQGYYLSRPVPPGNLVLGQNAASQRVSA